jgi:hypothetical protein
MTLPEFLSWAEFYEAYPFDDFNRFHRPAALVASAANPNREIRASLDWLQPLPKAAPAPGVLPPVQKSLANAFAAFPRPRRRAKKED